MIRRAVGVAATQVQVGLGRPPLVAAASRAFSDNVTYSGGQAGVQGGFYGAGGARSQASPQ